MASPIPLFESAAAAGDFDGDGHLDLALRNGGQNLLVIVRGDGRGNFTELSRQSIGSISYSITAGDVDGDHRQDIVIGRSDPSGFEIYFGKETDRSKQR